VKTGLPGIRRARPDEADVLLSIQREASLAAFGHIFPPERQEYPDDEVRTAWRVALADPEVEVYVADVDDEPVGSVSVGGEFLRTLYVLPARWRTGVGSALHDHALERLRARGRQRARLWTLEENEPGRRFYENRGWMLGAETRVVPFPPNPIDVEYVKEL